MGNGCCSADHAEDETENVKFANDWTDYIWNCADSNEDGGLTVDEITKTIDTIKSQKRLSQTLRY